MVAGERNWGRRGLPIDFFDFALKILDFTRFNRHLSRSKLNWRVRNEESEIPG